MNHTKLDLIVAELMFPILVKLAPSGETIRYKEMADLLKIKNPDVPEIANITQRHIGRKLGTIWEFTKSQGCPHIGALVVTKDGECGTGISSIVFDLPKERVKIKTFDWSSISIGFNLYLQKVKLIQINTQVKKIKRTEDEANECFFSYWKEIKDKAPISRDEAMELKERILLLVRDGISPEEAFSQELLRFLKTKKRQTPDTGYVYFGEFLNSETKEPIFDQIKIGYTSDLTKRALTLSGGVLGPLEFVIRYFWEFDSRVAFAVEQALHGRFFQFRKKGEFFHNPSSLLAELVDDEITQNFSDLLKTSNFE